MFQIKLNDYGNRFNNFNKILNKRDHVIIKECGKSFRTLFRRLLQKRTISFAK